MASKDNKLGMGIGERAQANLPGPGKYNLQSTIGSFNSTYQDSLSFSVSKVRSPRAETGATIIGAGPGQYEVDATAVKKKIPCYGFHGSPRGLIDKPKGQKGRAPFSIVEPDVDNPHFARPPNHRFGNEVRALRIPGAADESREKVDKKSPRPVGPEKYNPDGWKASRNATPTFSFQARREKAVDKDMKSVGPASYNIRHYELEKMKSDSSRAERISPTSKKSSTPGPGQYDTPVDFKGQRGVGPIWTMMEKKEVDVTLWA